MGSTWSARRWTRGRRGEFVQAVFGQGEGGWSFSMLMGLSRFQRSIFQVGGGRKIVKENRD